MMRETIRIPKAKAAKKRSAKRPLSFKLYVGKLVRQHNDSLSKDARNTLSDMAMSLTWSLANQAVELAQQAKQKTVMSGAVKQAAMIVMSKNLATHALSTASKLAKKYADEGGSKSARAALIFPVGRLHTHLKKILPLRVSPTAALWVAGLLNYVIADIVVNARTAMHAVRRKNKPTRITPRYIELGLLSDEDLDSLFRGTVAHGGVRPHIQTALLPRGKQVVAKTATAAQKKRASASKKKKASKSKSASKKAKFSGAAELKKILKRPAKRRS